MMQSEQYGSTGNSMVNNDVLQRKRVRAGSISGRLRTASDLEELGLIDKYQKGYIKDLIISGDAKFQNVLEKYERGDKKELEDLIRSGYLGRKQSIDILDDLDFDFLDGIKNDLDGPDAFGDDTFGFDFSTEHGHGHGHPHPINTSGSTTSGNQTQNKLRAGSIDQAGLFSFFENDAANENSLMDELQYLNRQYGDAPTAEFLGTYGAGADSAPAGSKPVSPRNRLAVDMAKTATANAQKGSGEQAETAGVPHVSFSRYVKGLEGAGDGEFNTLTGHKGRRDSWDIAAQYIQHEEDLVRGNGSVGGAGRGAVGAGAWQQGQGGLRAGAAGQVAAKPGTGVRKTNIKPEPGMLHASMAAAGVLKGTGAGGSSGGTSRPQTAGASFTAGGAGASSAAGGLGAGLRGLSTAGGTSTSTQHSAYNAAGSYLHSGGAALGGNGNGSGGVYDELGQRIGGPGFIGAYTPEQRRQRIEKFIEKRGRRVWTKKVKYDVRKNFADSRLRVKGRFVKKEDEDIMREILSI